jgi:ribonuclease HII
MYDLKKNKGYGTKKHIEAIKTIGPCEIHRRSFIKNFV